MDYLTKRKMEAELRKRGLSTNQAKHAVSVVAGLLRDAREAKQKEAQNGKVAV